MSSDLIVRLLDSEFSTLLTTLALIVMSSFITIYALPRLKKLKELESQPSVDSRAIDDLMKENQKLSSSYAALAKSIDEIKGSVDHQTDTLDDIQFSVHNARHDLTAVHQKLQTIVTSVATKTHDDQGFGDMRELR